MRRARGPRRRSARSSRARRPYAAYALGQLEPHLFRQTEWWHASGDDARGAACCTRAAASATRRSRWARRGALDALLRAASGPRHTFLTCELHHLDDGAAPLRPRPAADDDPHAGHGGHVPAGRRPPVRRLSGARRARDQPRSTAPTACRRSTSPRQIDDAVYFGAEREGALVAVAGTHVDLDRERDRRRRQRVHAPATIAASTWRRRRRAP